MHLYWELAKLSFRRQITYRAATLAGLSTNFFFGLLRAALLVALYGARQEVSGISIQAAITYTGITQATIAYLSLFSWYDLMRSVYTGEVGSDLLRPVSYFKFWMAQDFGRAFASLALRGLPIMLVYSLFFNIIIPHGLGQWLAMATALFLGWMVSFCWRFLVNLSAFWVPNAVGIGRLAFTLAYFMSGFLVPLRFMPDWFVRLCYLTPFPATVNAFIEIYLGLLDGRALWLALLNQVVWIVVLTAAIQLALRAGVRRLVILGG